MDLAARRAGGRGTRIGDGPLAGVSRAPRRSTPVAARKQQSFTCNEALKTCRLRCELERRASCSVQSKMPFERILVATDFSDSSEQALELAVSIAEQFGSELTLVHVWEAPNYSYAAVLYAPVDVVAPIERAAVARLEDATTKLKQRFPKANSLLRAGVPWQEVLAAATQTKADLIVMGTHGRRGLEHALLGSVAEKVVRMSGVPVLTVHGAAA